MKFIMFIWVALLVILTTAGVYATFSNSLFDEAEEFSFSLREDAVTGRRKRFFDAYFKKRGPTGGGFGYGK